MKQRLRARPSLEPLENRWCPAVTATVRNGILTVAGSAVNATDTVLVKETAANTFEVDDVTSGGSSTVVASGLTGVTGVKLHLTGASNLVSVDLGGNTLSGNLSANLGNTSTTLTVADGSISGKLAVAGRGGADTVTLGGTGTTLIVAGDSSVNLGTQSGTSVSVLSGVSIAGDLSASAASVTVNGTIDGNLNVNSGSEGHHGFGGFEGFGRFGGPRRFFGSHEHGDSGGENSQGPTTLTLGSTASVGGNLHYASAGTGGSLDIAGTVSGNADVRMSGTGTTATLESGASIDGRASFAFGSGTGTLTLAGTIGTAGNTGTALSVSTGSGNDTISVLSSAVINGNSRMRLGSGTDLVSLHDPATVTGTFALRGGAASTFHGSATTTHSTLDLSPFKGTQDNSPNP